MIQPYNIQLMGSHSKNVVLKHFDITVRIIIEVQNYIYIILYFMWTIISISLITAD